MNSKRVNTSEWFVQRVGISLWFRDCGKARWKLREQPFIMRHEQYAMNSVCAAPKARKMVARGKALSRAKRVAPGSIANDAAALKERKK